MTISVSITPEEHMQALLQELAYKRYEVDALDGNIKLLEERLQSNPEWQQLISMKSKKKEIEAEQTGLEGYVREHAVRMFDGQNKQVNDVVQIKVFDVVVVKDEKAALVWASANMPKALKLDRRTFDSAVKNLELDFIEVKEEPKAQIASDLSKYL